MPVPHTSQVAPERPSRPDDGGDPVTVVRDVRIPTADPQVTLSADLVLPVRAGEVPALVTVLPYRKDAVWGILDRETFRWYAEHGYGCVLVDLRGTGSSDGVLRPPFDPDEADDGVTAVEWAAEQPWCNGAVGMWGASYGAVTAMRTAARHPPPLKAILPVVGMVDPERDFVHPCGVRGGLDPVTSWGTQQLLYQLLPPLHNSGSAIEQRRWQDRLRYAEPSLVDLVRLGPGDPAWRSRAVDPASIRVPAFCIGGWLDLFCDGTVRAYEQISAPKKLLIGPWMHDIPDQSPFEPIDFRGLSLRWWDHWLKGTANGVMDEPPVTLYLQGEKPQWRQFASWPPADGQVRFATRADTTLRPESPAGPPSGSTVRDRIIAEHPCDPTAGAVSGLHGVPADECQLPPDQNSDDMRALTCTTDPLPGDLTIAGRVQVIVRLAPGCTPRRLVIKLTEVDPGGRSTLITSGTVASPDPASSQVRLTPTYYRVRAGQRLRVVVGDADFPRLWPVTCTTSENAVLRLSSIGLELPLEADTAGTDITMPPAAVTAAPAEAAGLDQRPAWNVTRDLINGRVEIAIGGNLAARIPDGEHQIEIHRALSATVTRANPAAAFAQATFTATCTLPTGDTVAVRATTEMSSAAATATGQVSVNGTTVFARQWETAVPAECPGTTEHAR